MIKKHPVLFRIFWMVIVLFVSGLFFALAFYLSTLFFHYIRFTPTPIITQIINSFLGLLMISVVLNIIARAVKIRPRHTFQPIIDAMESIAQGNFDIRLDGEEQEGIMHGLIDSVNKMAHDLGEMESMRQEFVSNVSHEIQSPLTSIRGFAEALQNDNLSPQDRHHYLEIIRQESDRLSRLSNDLLRLASLESDQVKFDPQPYRLDQQVKSVILTSEPQWHDKSLNVEAFLSELTIVGDEDLLSQVWMNLLHNSIKFTPPGGSIQVAVTTEAENVIFSISDTGIGISAEDQVHVFERFYKADKSRTRAAGGNGLGLAIVTRIINLHHGSINLTSEAGKGTTFTVSLPIHQA
ncbi:MAG: HAMP domain-containing histidine kinase [Anaerolineae bacterium]|nr:HAMP domain-containing histidine kinase [Anaerolineae bacterium]